jgi:thiol-disulfide isomerase/thioredoxin
VGWTLALLAVVALAVIGLSSDHSAQGRAAPALPRETLVGPTVTLASLQRGAGRHGSLVVFWASWCGPCAREAPALQRFATSAEGRGRLVGVDWSDPSVASARAFIRHYGWTFPVLRDGEGLVGNAYRLPVLPTTFVLDGKGRIRGELRGPQNEASLQRALQAVT